MEEKPNYYAILPANIRYDKRLTDKAKLLYAEITSLTYKTGECWASNKYFSDLYAISVETVSRIIKLLIDNGYLERKIIYKSDTKEISNRVLIPIDKNINTYCQKNQYPIDENVKENNTSINNKNINNIYIGQVVDYLNEKTGSKYKSTTASTKSHILARFREGFKLDDFKKVIEKKTKEWKGTKYQKYLRPETLFGTKFESYLNQKDKENWWDE